MTNAFFLRREPLSEKKILTIELLSPPLPSTLFSESFFFTSLLSDRWVNSSSDNSSYFVNADPDLFAHILCYLQHRVLPIVYNKSHRFNHVFIEHCKRRWSILRLSHFICELKTRNMYRLWWLNTQQRRLKRNMRNDMTLQSMKIQSDHIIHLKKQRRCISVYKAYSCTMKTSVLVKECVRKLKRRVQIVMLNKISCKL